jgi:hypothetical protein
LLLSRPLLDCRDTQVARIDLGTRQIGLNGGEIARRGLWDCLEAILAHEIGHHVRYPATLAVSARMRLLERSLIPIEGYSLVNLFADLLINEHLGADPGLRGELCRVYATFADGREWERDPAFLFYLTVYEELWQRERGELLGGAFREFSGAYPDHRADAQLLAQELFHMGPNVYTQLLYFVSIVGRYIEPRLGDKPESGDPYGCGCGEPSPDDWAGALTPTAREREAIRRALESGWISAEQAAGMTDAIDRRIHALPGSGTDDAERVPEIMAAFYRQQAERFLLRPPAQRTLGEAVVPTTLEEWEPGDPAAAIDWLATLVQRGDRLGAALPLRRERIADYEGHDVPLWRPRTEIYLDVSGSMPDPRSTINAMTLAAQILTVGTVRAGGWVRALLYSGDHVSYWSWCRSEVEISRFLMHYIGGGTCFPFPTLAESVEQCGREQPIRIIISDSDFDANYLERTENARVFAEAAARSAPLVMLLHLPNPERIREYERAGAKIVPVTLMDDFPRMAAALSFALFSDGAAGAGPAIAREGRHVVL